MAEPPLFTLHVTGASKVKALLDRTAAVAQFSLSKGQLERLLVDRTKRRFDPRRGGTAGVEQKDPDGNYWPDLEESTIKYKKGASGNRMLYSTGNLQAAITATRSRLTGSVLRSPTGGGFTIGVRNGGRRNKHGRAAEDYARYHQFGTDDMKQRRFLGVGRPDVIAVNDMIERNFAKAGLR